MCALSDFQVIDGNQLESAPKFADELRVRLIDLLNAAALRQTYAAMLVAVSSFLCKIL
jgi:hypothetical protein